MITVNFNSKEDEIAQQLKEIAQGQPISRYVKSVLSEHVQKYNSNPILAEKSNESAKVEGALIVLNDMQLMNRFIQNMDEQTAKILESTLFALNTKVSKKLNYGTINVR